MPRNRTARMAVLASVAQRTAATPYSSRASSALRRRAVAAALVLVSLTLITVYFRESDGGRLHGIQGTAASVLKPFEVAAERVSQPFQDAYGYFADLIHAKSKVDRLERDNSALRQKIIANQDAVQQNKQLKQAVGYKAPPELADLPRITTSVISQPQNQFDQTLAIGAGANDGIRKNNAVLDPRGNLVGTVVLVYSHTALVRLIIDAESFVAAKDLSTGAKGVIKQAQSTGTDLTLDRVSKQERVHLADTVITSGFRWNGLSSLYPKGIPVGWVSTTSQVDTDYFKRVQVTPYADLSNLETVMVVVTPEEGRGLP